MTIVVAPLTNTAYGFPRGKLRRVKPFVLACVHITGNSRTAATTNLLAAALGERSYANRAGSPGPSATGYVARNGIGVLAVDPDRFAAWSNGDVSAPRTSNPGIRRVLALRAKGYNANEAYWEEWELLGFGSAYPVTPEQTRFVAERIAARSKKSGLPINRETVHGHWEINGVDRRNCPVPYARREKFLADIIALARASAAPPAPSQEAEMPTLLYRIIEPAVGTVTVSIDGASIVTPDGVPRDAPKGDVRDCIAKVSLLEPLDTRAGDRQTAWLVGKLSTEATNSQIALLLAYAGTFTPAAPPAPVDPKPAINVALDKFEAAATPAIAAAISAAIRSARP